jgi:hypothetical protein
MAGRPVNQNDSAWFWDPRVLRKFWFDAMSQAMDSHLRSVAFLELMQHTLRSMNGPMLVPNGAPELQPVQGPEPSPVDDRSAKVDGRSQPSQTSDVRSP